MVMMVIMIHKSYVKCAQKTAVTTAQTKLLPPPPSQLLPLLVGDCASCPSGWMAGWLAEWRVIFIYKFPLTTYQLMTSL